jgi:hypothetical protein
MMIDCKSLAVKRDSFDNKRTRELVNGLLPVKTPMFLLSKPTFITMRVEDLDKNLHYEKCNRNGKTINYN